MLCALNLNKACPTFRPAERGLAPERQLAFVFRTHAASPPPAPAGEQPGWGQSSAVAFGG